MFNAKYLTFLFVHFFIRTKGEILHCPLDQTLHSLQTCFRQEVNNISADAVFSTLKYHRKMMNEFLLSSYLAALVMNSTKKNYIKTNSASFERRTGLLSSNMSLPDSKGQNMLTDEGSTKYKNWLEKTVTFNDIQRQILEKADTPESTQNRMSFEPTIMEYNDDEDDIDYGDITGYAYSNSSLEPVVYDSQPFVPLPSNQFLQTSYKPNSKTGYEANYEQHKNHYMEQPPVPARQEGHEIGLRDIADIAMTTLAFLSFGMFILQVLICITMGKEDAANMNLAMQATDETEAQVGLVDEIRRKKRSVEEAVNQNLIIENEISRLALFTLDTMLDKDEIENCRNWCLCRSTQLAKLQQSKAKLWLPLWSLALTWTRHRHPAYKSNHQKGSLTILDNVKAIMMGLVSETNCQKIYFHNCKRKI